MPRAAFATLTFVVPLVFFLGGREPPAPAADLPLDQRSLDYVEDGAGRVVAAIEALLFRDRLEVRVRPRGPKVEPVPGYRGRAGANTLTARELQILLDEQLLEVLTRSRGSHPTRGQVAITSREPLPERRLGPDGRLDFDARSLRSYPVELRSISVLAGPGSYTTEFVVRGVPRLRVRLQLDPQGGRIEALEAVADGPDKEAL